MQKANAPGVRSVRDYYSSANTLKILEDSIEDTISIDRATRPLGFNESLGVNATNDNVSKNKLLTQCADMPQTENKE